MQVEAPAQPAHFVAQKPAKPVQAPAPGTFLPSAVDLQALRAGVKFSTSRLMLMYICNSTRCVSISIAPLDT